MSDQPVFENRLKSIAYPNGNTENFVYDYAGELLQRTTAQGTLNYAYGQGVAPLAEIRNFGPSPNTDFVQINGKTVGAIGGAKGPGKKGLLFYHTDGVGSVIGITDGTGTVVENDLYDPFGVLLSQNTTFNKNQANPYLFVGAYGVRHVNVTGGGPGMNFDHSIMGQRIYDSSIGRFTTEDPLGLTTGTNLYRYGQNNPISLIDPSGNKEFTITFGEGGSAGWWVLGASSVHATISSSGERNSDYTIYVFGVGVGPPSFSWSSYPTKFDWNDCSHTWDFAGEGWFESINLVVGKGFSYTRYKIPHGPTLQSRGMEPDTGNFSIGITAKTTAQWYLIN